MRIWWFILSEGVFNTKFKRVEKIRYLGVHIAKNLTLNPHLEQISTKLNYISSKINMVSRQIVKLNRLISLFYVLMKSILDLDSEL